VCIDRHASGRGSPTHIYMYVNTYVYVFWRASGEAFLYVLENIQKRCSGGSPTYIYIYMYIYMYIYIDVHSHVLMCVCVCVYIYTHLFIFIYIYICIHLHSYTFICMYVFV
jgi:hypothetical protein